MPAKQKQKQSQNVKVVVNLAERKQRRRRVKRTVKKIIQEQSGLRQQPNINISSTYQAPTIPYYGSHINTPAPVFQPYSIQELRKAFLDNLAVDAPASELRKINPIETVETPAPTPIETPADITEPEIQMPEPETPAPMPVTTSPVNPLRKRGRPPVVRTPEQIRFDREVANRNRRERRRELSETQENFNKAMGIEKQDKKKKE